MANNTFWLKGYSISGTTGSVMANKRDPSLGRISHVHFTEITEKVVSGTNSYEYEFHAALQRAKDEFFRQLRFYEMEVPKPGGRVGRRKPSLAPRERTESKRKRRKPRQRKAGKADLKRLADKFPDRNR